MDPGLGLFQANAAAIQARIKDCVELLRLGMAAGEAE
jgi:hypothetical protein